MVVFCHPSLSHAAFVFHLRHFSIPSWQEAKLHASDPPWQKWKKSHKVRFRKRFDDIWLPNPLCSIREMTADGWCETPHDLPPPETQNSRKLRFQTLKRNLELWTVAGLLTESALLLAVPHSKDEVHPVSVRPSMWCYRSAQCGYIFNIHIFSCDCPRMWLFGCSLGPYLVMPKEKSIGFTQKGFYWPGGRFLFS